MALQEGDHVRLQCEDCFRPLGRFVLYHLHGEGPLVLRDAAPWNRCANPSKSLRQQGYRGGRKGRVWGREHQAGGRTRYRYECRCGRTILLSTNRVQRLALMQPAGSRDAVFLV